MSAGRRPCGSPHRAAVARGRAPAPRCRRRRRLGQFVDQRAEAADRDADQPDRLVARGALRLKDVVMKPFDESLVVVVRHVGIDEQRVGGHSRSRTALMNPSRSNSSGFRNAPGRNTRRVSEWESPRASFRCVFIVLCRASENGRLQPAGSNANGEHLLKNVTKLTLSQDFEFGNRTGRQQKVTGPFTNCSCRRVASIDGELRHIADGNQLAQFQGQTPFSSLASLAATSMSCGSS